MIKNKPLFYTVHQLKRMAKRGMSKDVVEIVVSKGDWRRGNKPLSFEVEYKGVIVVLYEQKVQYNVSSCKLNRIKTIEAENLQKRLGIDFWKAVHKIVKSIDFSQEFEEIL
jgi:hypothetical protein